MRRALLLTVAAAGLALSPGLEAQEPKPSYEEPAFEAPGFDEGGFADQAFPHDITPEAFLVEDLFPGPVPSEDLPPEAAGFAGNPEAALEREIGIAQVRIRQLEEALEEFEASEEAAVVALPTGRAYPHDHEIPTLTCLPARFCEVVLEEGERVSGYLFGDELHWTGADLTRGPEDRPTPHVFVRPMGYGLRTNLTILTDRRAYRLEVVSPDREELAEPAEYDFFTTFWYPRDWSERKRQAEAERFREASRRDELLQLDLPVDLGSLRFGYRFEEPRREKRRLPWKPVTVFDDTARTYLRLPHSPGSGDLPVLLGTLSDGSTFPLHYTVRDGWMVVDGTFERALLVRGTGKREQRLEIVRRGGGTS